MDPATIAALAAAAKKADETFAILDKAGSLAKGTYDKLSGYATKIGNWLGFSSSKKPPAVPIGSKRIQIVRFDGARVETVSYSVNAAVAYLHQLGAVDIPAKLAFMKKLTDRIPVLQAQLEELKTEVGRAKAGY